MPAAVVGLSVATQSMRDSGYQEGHAMQSGVEEPGRHRENRTRHEGSDDVPLGRGTVGSGGVWLTGLESIMVAMVRSRWVGFGGGITQ